MPEAGRTPTCSRRSSSRWTGTKKSVRPPGAPLAAAAPPSAPSAAAAAAGCSRASAMAISPSAAEVNHFKPYSLGGRGSDVWAGCSKQLTAEQTARPAAGPG